MLLGAAGGIWFLTGRSAQARDLGPSVSITTPVTGDILDLGNPLTVSATGYDPRNITRLELYVNGILTAVQASTPDTESSSLDGFAASWTPTTAGRYILTVRGYTSDGLFADSSIVIVDVVTPASQVTGSLAELLPAPADQPCPSLNQIALMLGISLEDLLALNPGLRGTDADLSLECVTIITLPRSTTPPPGLDGGSPGGSDSTPGGTGDTGTTPSGIGTMPGDTGTTGAPPILLPGSPSIPAWVSVDPSACTSIILTWTGSPDAEGYTLYRNAPGDSHLNAIAHLPSNQVIYTDTITLAGVYIYQVAAVHAGFEALSATFSFTTLDYPACSTSLRSPEPPAGSSLYLILPSLQTDTAYEGAYCYVSMDGGAQGRLPAADFSSLIPLSDGLTYDLRSSPTRGRYLLTRTGSDPITLEMRCMGRRGVYSDSLGGFLASHPSPEWDGQELISTGTGGTGAFTVHYCITSDPALTDCINPSGSTPPGLFPVTPPLSPILYAADLPAPTHLRIEINTDACDAMPATDERLACNRNHGGPMLFWDWRGGGPPYIYDDSTLTGFQIAASANGKPWLMDGEFGGRSRSTPSWQGRMDCNSTITYTVTAVQGSLHSLPSAPLTISTPNCPPIDHSRVQVIFESLALTRGYSGTIIDNGPIFDTGDVCIICRDNEFELSGSFYASTSRINSHTLVWKPAGEDFVRLTAPGIYNLADQPLSSDPGSLGQTGNNIITLDLSGPSTARVEIEFGMRIIEHDALGATAQECAIRASHEALPIFNWGQLRDTYVTFQMNRFRDLYTSSLPNIYRGTDSVKCILTVKLIGELLP
jgi:hypothetical protein